ncbi:unnamed protein product [Euphydryas editha]|uniref:Uncharacterized protein n=1 Tax=Euphydryas editha TaxID=104508 RepID=A0AAU9TWD9_EUPED|nr:unnamed protein product [Euphydryas editha]
MAKAVDICRSSELSREHMKVLTSCNKKNASPYLINLSNPSPQSSYTLNYQGVSQSNLAQSRYTGTPSIAPRTIIIIPRSSLRPHGVVYNTDPTPQGVINSVETISSGGQSAHGDYYESTGSTSQTEEIDTYNEECKKLLNNYLTFK